VSSVICVDAVVPAGGGAAPAVGFAGNTGGIEVCAAAAAAINTNAAVAITKVRMAFPCLGGSLKALIRPSVPFSFEHLQSALQFSQRTIRSFTDERRPAVGAVGFQDAGKEKATSLTMCGPLNSAVIARWAIRRMRA
jgi:hypothetical protein